MEIPPLVTYVKVRKAHQSQYTHWSDWAYLQNIKAGLCLACSHLEIVLCQKFSPNPQYLHSQHSAAAAFQPLTKIKPGNQMV